MSQLREKMETNMRLAVDTVNQLIGSTNQTLLSQYNERQRRLYEWYEKAQIDMKTELSNAHVLLERLIEEAGEIIANMQTHFERLMSSTVERTYGDMIGMLSSAIGNIQTVCLEIMDKLKHSPSEANALKAVESNRPALTNVIERGLGLINQVADKLKNDMDFPIYQKSADGSGYYIQFWTFRSFFSYIYSQIRNMNRNRFLYGEKFNQKILRLLIITEYFLLF